MRIEYSDILIRNAEKNDIYILEKWWNDGTVMAHAGFPNGLGTTAEEIRQKIQHDSDKTERRLMIEFQNIPIGEMVYRNSGNQTAEIGIKICEADFQEKGIGRVVLSLLIKELFSMGFIKIVLDTDLQNKRAQHVYEKLGFHKTGIRYDAWKDQVGNMRSAVDYELTKERFVDYAKL